MLERQLEPEVMDSPEEARDYDAMDHSQVNQRFVADLLAAVQPPAGDRWDVLDLGTGTAQIPIQLCRDWSDCRVLAVDLAGHMLDLARGNVDQAGFLDRVELAQVDAKRLPYDDAQFELVMSNSIVHHLPHPATALAEAVRVTRPGGWLFFRDLLRPHGEGELEQLVATYAGHENSHQQQMFRDSLHAALTVDEVRTLVDQLGFEPVGVQATSDRHWTWSARRPSA